MDSNDSSIVATAGMTLNDSNEVDPEIPETPEPEEPVGNRIGSFTYMCDTDKSILSSVGNATNGTVTWSDGTTDVELTPSEPFDAKAETTYTVTFDGTTNALRPLSTSQATDCLRSVNEWPAGIRNINAAFSGEDNLTSVPNYLPEEVTSLSGTFLSVTSFNDPAVSSWDVSNVTNMSTMFQSATSFNQDLTAWDTSNVTNMKLMFAHSNFNGDISNWDVSNVTNMENMFYNTSTFNRDLTEWDTSNVTSMRAMFGHSSFNGDISTWDVGNVTNMQGMFSFNKSFNRDISEWDTSNVANMKDLFSYSNFNQDISTWNVDNVTDHSNFATGGKLTAGHMPKFKD